MERFKSFLQNNFLENKKLMIEEEKAKSFTESETEEKRSLEYEQRLVLSDPDMFGLNFDQSFIVDGRNYWSEERLLEYYKTRGVELFEEIKSKIATGEVQNIISLKREEENTKQEIFYKYLSNFGEKLKHVRIHPYGEASPLTPSQAIEKKSDGTFTININQEFVDQIKKIQESVKNITLVIQFYNHRKEKVSHIPQNREEFMEYQALCQKVIDEFGENIQLEIGNETNVSKETGPMFTDKLQHTYIDAEEYGKFFYHLAKNLKKENPNIKLSLAGVACFDPTYLEKALMEIRKQQTEHNIKDKLVDTISFHPYREKPEEGSAEIKNGEFISNYLNYDEQMIKMQKIASEFDVELTVGEIGFPFSDSRQKEKLAESINKTKEKGIVSFIYPGQNIE